MKWPFMSRHSSRVGSYETLSSVICCWALEVDRSMAKIKAVVTINNEIVLADFISRVLSLFFLLILPRRKYFQQCRTRLRLVERCVIACLISALPAKSGLSRRTRKLLRASCRDCHSAAFVNGCADNSYRMDSSASSISNARWLGSRSTNAARYNSFQGLSLRSRSDLPGLRLIQYQRTMATSAKSHHKNHVSWKNLSTVDSPAQMRTA